MELLYELLEPLRLYRLHTDSLVDRELACYGRVFSWLQGMLDDIRAQAFVQTATGGGLALHEELVGLYERPDVNPQDRRELVIYRLSTSPTDFTNEGMVRSVRAAGLDAEIIEHPYPEERLTIISKRLIDSFADLDQVKAGVERMLPTHLQADFDIGVLTWDMFDAADPAWNGWDAMDFSWNRFDLDGQYLFGDGMVSGEPQK